MFGYVTPCIAELKIKDYEKFKAYYCGLCKSIKKNYGNLPRLTLNYDMTFLCILLDALKNEPNEIARLHCVVHPVRKKSVILNNPCIDHAAFCNVVLSYYKLLDDFNDDKSINSKFRSSILKVYMNKVSKQNSLSKEFIKTKLNELSMLENKNSDITLDELSHPFAELTAYIIASFYLESEFYDTLYSLGYNLGKWIYIIDAFDDLEKDMKKNKFNAINKALNKDNLSYELLFKSLKQRIDFVLTSCANACLQNLNKLGLKKNQELLYNILQYGLMQRIEKVLLREKPETINTGGI